MNWGSFLNPFPKSLKIEFWVISMLYACRQAWGDAWSGAIRAHPALSSKLPPPQSQCHWFPVEPALRALQIASAGGSWANTRVTSSPPTTRGITPPTSSVPGTSTRRPSARSSSWYQRSSSPPRMSAATSWSCGKTVGNRARHGAQGRRRGRKKPGFGRAAFCKGRKPHPWVAGGNFGELGERGIGIALPPRCLRGMWMG